MIEISPRLSVAERAVLHRALGDEHRLEIVDRLVTSDRTPGELGELTGIPSNLLAFHLGVLEEARLVERRRSEGDSRRRYIHLRSHAVESAGVISGPEWRGRVVFVCTHNSARSQFAEALWRSRAGGEVWSAGTEPADRVHPHAVEAGRHFGVDLSGMRPKGYQAIPPVVELVVSVCDRALESGVPIRGDRVHWSVPDPVGQAPEVFEKAFADIADRFDRVGSRTG